MKDGKFNMFAMKDMSRWFMFFFTMAGPEVCDYVLEQPAVSDLIHSDQKFDLILAEVFLDEGIIAGMAHKFKAPIVGVMSFMPNVWGNYLVSISKCLQ